ncbi:hypothetical protein [Nocardia pseudobrasiliensis]|uniref:hypothetical protein n=1 Tax=Nocardia pseudobrasiliensis TaxID=45979 RepID=UPI0011C07CA8|nr:hypothetical protein [Nocardia pseudobrasiliensis]
MGEDGYRITEQTRSLLQDLCTTHEFIGRGFLGEAGAVAAQEISYGVQSVGDDIQRFTHGAHRG